MQKRDIGQLALYHIEEAVEVLPLICLRKLYLEKTSEIVYIIKDNKLYGIISLGDVLNHSRNGKVKINKMFTMVLKNSLVEAKEILMARM